MITRYLKERYIRLAIQQANLKFNKLPKIQKAYVLLMAAELAINYQNDQAWV